MLYVCGWWWGVKFVWGIGDCLWWFCGGMCCVWGVLFDYCGVCWYIGLGWWWCCWGLGDVYWFGVGCGVWRDGIWVGVLGVVFG